VAWLRPLAPVAAGFPANSQWTELHSSRKSRDLAPAVLGASPRIGSGTPLLGDQDSTPERDCQMSMEQDPVAAIGRRGLIIGAGAAALIAGAAAVQPAAAKPTSPHGSEVITNPRSAEGSPITTTIASAPLSGYTYRTVSMYDFEPFFPASQRTWGGSGTYTAGTEGPLRATVEIPPGALVRDVEYYVYNNSGSPVFPDAYLYVAGHGTISSINATVSVPSSASISATRAVVGAATYGPYPLASRLLISLDTPTTGTVQINGARVGFTQASGEIGLLSTPFRAYDSRVTGGKLTAGTTRTVTIPANIVVPGTTGLIVNLTAVQGEANGYLKLFSAAAAEPASSALNFSGSGAAIANGLIVAVSSGRQINIKADKTVHFVVDVTGTIA
jgi:hypothetical protein